MAYIPTFPVPKPDEQWIVKEFQTLEDLNEYLDTIHPITLDVKPGGNIYMLIAKVWRQKP